MVKKVKDKGATKRLIGHADFAKAIPYAVKISILIITLASLNDLNLLRSFEDTMKRIQDYEYSH